MKNKTLIIILAIVILIAIALIIWNFRKGKSASNQINTQNQNTVDATLRRKLENECETLFNTQADVDACVAQKLVA